MKTVFKKSTTDFGCYAETNEQDQYLPNEDFTITDVLNSAAPLKDKAWFIISNCELTETQLREFAVKCAEIVLPIYEEKYPDNKAPRAAIEAVKAYLAGTISLDELIAKRNAVYAAVYAAVVPAAATTATAAAAAAYNACAWAADAYAADAYAADASRKNATYQDLLLTFFKEFINGNQ